MEYPVQNLYPYGIATAKRVRVHGEMDYVKDETLFKGGGSKSVMVNSQSDLANIGEYAPGTIAYTAGFKKMWQLSAGGTWVDILEV